MIGDSLQKQNFCKYDLPSPLSRADLSSCIAALAAPICFTPATQSRYLLRVYLQRSEQSRCRSRVVSFQSLCNTATCRRKQVAQGTYYAEPSKVEWAFHFRIDSQRRSKYYFICKELPPWHTAGAMWAVMRI